MNKYIFSELKVCIGYYYDINNMWLYVFKFLKVILFLLFILKEKCL